MGKREPRESWAAGRSRMDAHRCLAPGLSFPSSSRSFSRPLPAACSEKREQAAKAAGNNDAPSPRMHVRLLEPTLRAPFSPRGRARESDRPAGRDAAATSRGPVRVSRRPPHTRTRGRLGSVAFAAATLSFSAAWSRAPARSHGGRPGGSA
jgi:hypothetical protein